MTERLVLLPGWSYPAAVLQPLAGALHGDALRVELAELPALEDPQQWLDELDARLPPDCWLGGWSLGGMLAAELAARRGAACHGLITLASNACFVQREDWPVAMPAAQFADFRDGVAAAPAAALKRFDLLAVRDADEPRALARQLAARGDSSAALLAGLDCLAQLDLRAALREWAGPHLHLLGGRDALVPREVARALGELAPNARIELLDDASHALPLSHAAQTAAAILAFIKETSR